MNEIWKEINDYDGVYLVSNLGNIKSIDRYVETSLGVRRFIPGMILKHSKNRTGYPTICLSKNNTFSSKTLHRLVAIAFIPNPENKRCVNHKNGIRHDDNRVENLEWVTDSENTIHACRVLKSIVSPRQKLNKLKVILIRQLMKKGFDRIEMATLYDVHESTIRDIVERKTWKYI